MGITWKVRAGEKVSGGESPDLSGKSGLDDYCLSRTVENDPKLPVSNG
jgi:hypothetical protein